MTSSSTPGYAMRASGPGPTVGIALENFGPDDAATVGQTGKILCFVHADRGDAQVSALQKQNRNILEENAALRHDMGEMKALLCYDHPGAALCR
ncbi:MAG: hypothetical protein ACYCPQ_01630 [Elusimicrobiota bacterium]